MVEISMLGSGSGMNPDLGNTSFFVSENGGPRLLIDCGFTVPAVLAKKNAMKSVEHIALTHTHSDHVGGLELLGFFKMFAPPSVSGKKPTLYLPSEKMAYTLWEHTLRGGMGFSRGDHKFGFEGYSMDLDRPLAMLGANGLEVHGRNVPGIGDDLFDEIYEMVGPGKNLDDYFNVKVARAHKINDKSIEFFQTPHTRGLENYGVRITTDNTNVFYSGDTIAVPGQLPDEDLIIQDLQFPDFNIPYGQTDVNPTGQLNAHTTFREVTNPIYKEHIGDEQRAKTYFTHLWAEHTKRDNDLTRHGYGGFLLPGDHIRVENHKVTFSQ